MTQCVGNPQFVQSVLFPDIFAKPVALEFTDDRQTNDTGALLFSALDRRIGLTDRIAAVLPDDRCAGKVEHPVLDILRQRVYGLLAGYEDANDAARLRNDPAFRILLGRSLDPGDALASQPTISRFENALPLHHSFRWGEALCDFVIERQRRRHKHVRRITIDLDPTDDATHGDQQLTFFNTFYGGWCYLPLLAYITFHDRHGREEPEQHLVAALLRPGSAKAPLGASAILRRLVRKLRRAFPGVILRVRLDGGFAGPEILDLLESLGVEYVINVAKNDVLIREAESLLRIARREAKRTGQTARVWGERRYAAGTWKDKRRRVVIKAEVTISPREPDKEPRDNPRFVVTNLKAHPKHVYRATYCRRGDAENRIKELNLDAALGRTSCTSFAANQVRVLLAATAYVLVQEMRSACAGTEAARWQMGTIRVRLVKFAGLLVESARRFLVRLPRYTPDARLFSEIGRRLAALPSPSG
jgi:hypothetical protein